MRHNHRRIKKSRIRTVYAYQRSVQKDNEGVPTVAYADPYSMRAEVWPAGGRLQVEQYGDRISDITNLRIQGQYEVSPQGSAYGILFADGHRLTIGDGVRIDSQDGPDYAVLAITPYYPVKVEAQRI